MQRLLLVGSERPKGVLKNSRPHEEKLKRLVLSLSQSFEGIYSIVQRVSHTSSDIYQKAA